MSGTTSVPPVQITTTGLLLPSEADLLAGVQADLNAALGGNLNPALETPQGQIATTETAIISDKNDQFLLLTQNVDPAFSQGRFQDGIARIYFLTRYPARPTVVQATCRGLQGVTIPIGALARAIDGNYYTSTASGTIGSDGTVTLPFQCNVTGPIACPTDALNRVYLVIPGWDSIINNADGVLGQHVESRAEFELRRFNSVAGNSAGMLASVQGAVLALPDVLDAFTTENFTSADKNDSTTDGITLKAHSLYVCVAGGAAPDIAQAIFTKKSSGCDMSGNTTVTVYDNNGGYNPPAPQYSITYQVALPQTFIISVTLINSPVVPSDVLTQVRNAIMKAWIGEDGGSRARIGSTVFASRYYGPVSLLGTWVQLVSIKLGSSGQASTFTGSITGNQLTATAGTVTLGSTIMGSNIPDGVQVLSSAGGGVYTLTMSFATAIPSQSMLSVPPNLDDIKVGIAHVPVLAAENVNVVMV